MAPYQPLQQDCVGVDELEPVIQVEKEASVFDEVKQVVCCLEGADEKFVQSNHHPKTPRLVTVGGRVE